MYSTTEPLSYLPICTSNASRHLRAGTEACTGYMEQQTRSCSCSTHSFYLESTYVYRKPLQLYLPHNTATGIQHRHQQSLPLHRHANADAVHSMLPPGPHHSPMPIRLPIGEPINLSQCVICTKPLTHQRLSSPQSLKQKCFHSHLSVRATALLSILYSAYKHQPVDSNAAFQLLLGTPSQLFLCTH